MTAVDILQPNRAGLSPMLSGRFHIFEIKLIHTLGITTLSKI